MPETSVILPTYNRADHLPRAIDSVLEQTYEDFELIVVDDASTDHTPQVMDDYDDPRIEYIRLEENRGSARARNEGLKQASGRYVAFQDSDDRWLSGKLEKQIEVLGNAPSDVAVVYPGGVNVHGESRLYVPSPALEQYEGDVYDQLLFNMFVNIHSLVRYDALEKVGFFDDRLRVFVDWDLFLRLADRYEFRYIDEPLAEWYREADKDRSRQNEQYDRSIEIMVDKHESDYRRVAREKLAPAMERDRPIVVWGAGLAGYHFARVLRRVGIELEGFVDVSPDKQDTSVAALPVQSPDDLDRWEDPFVVVKSLHAEEIVDDLENSGFTHEEDYRVL